MLTRMAAQWAGAGVISTALRAAACAHWAPATVTSAVQQTLATGLPPTHSSGLQPQHTSGFSSSSGNQQQQKPSGGTPPLSKSFLAGKLSQEELWLATLPPKIKIWAVRTRPQLKGRENEVVEEVRSEFLRLMTKHAAGRMLTNQSRFQLKLACLSASTYDVLMKETGGDEAAVDEHIKQSMGSIYAPFLLGSLKAVSWVKSMLFNEKPFKLAKSTLGDIAKDMEGSCLCVIEEDRPGQHATLTVDSCLFHEVLAAEGKPQLLANLCCQHNMSWLSAYASQGVGSHLESCMARGDKCCRIAITAEERAASK